SRQRSWGVPITVISCRSCGEVVKSEALIEKIDELFLKEGADAWFSHGVEDFLEEGTTCASCGSTDFVKEEDILDVWFDSGVSHAAVCEERVELDSPADLYLEGSDQHRGWFQSSLLSSVGTRGTAPFKGVLTHGYVVDGQGKKMSKSVGNVVAPGEVIEKYGAEILRLWVASEDYRDDIKVSDEILKQVSDSYRKVRNTIRYMLGNLSDFKQAEHGVAVKDLPELDRWALAKFEEFRAKVIKGYEKYEFHTIYQAMNYFCGTTMSAFYLDIVKDRLYVSGTHSHLRRSAQSVLFEILDGLLRLLAPILCFTAEEAWNSLHTLDQRDSIDKGIFFVDFPDSLAVTGCDSEMMKKWERLITLRSEITKALEIARREKVIGHSLEAEVLIKTADDDLASFLEEEWQTVKEISIISELSHLRDEAGDSGIIFESEEIKGVTIHVLAAGGDKCERCWIRSTTVGEHQEHPEICERCVAVVTGDLL
ncbi:MAG: class I tRNA ligase family protein, partial [Deltaproteobacteria bacterium]|nr:class I tRNA ligase family protein [Deltaproteobacteria bacterium]